MLALACDITLVSSDCKIRFPSIPIGGGFVSSFWAFFVGPKRAKEMDFVAGSEISGADAEAWGWANRAFPPAELEARATQMAKAISKTPPDLLRLKKMAINRVVEWQGFRQAMIGGAEWDTLSHFSDGAREMRQRVVDLGMKEAIKSLQA
jgi:enoyl-CoA hydratase